MRGAFMFEAIGGIDEQFIKSAKEGKGIKFRRKNIFALVACLALAVAVIVPIRVNMGTRIQLSEASTGVTARYVAHAPTVHSSESALIPLTEDELFTHFHTAIFEGTVNAFSNIVVDCNGAKNNWAIVKIEVSKTFRGNIPSGDTVSVLIESAISDGPLTEDTETVSHLRVGMNGIFMPMIYDSTSTYEENGAILMLEDLAGLGFADGVRFAFLETDGGLVFDRTSFAGVSDAATLDEIEEYIIDKIG